ncbi:MAG: DNA polymerase III subunit gamma/tau, partial [Opitutaceae bacterium]
QLTRMLDGLREGEGNVKLGLAEKINFEVTLLKAVEASRARAIDSLIKELASLAGEEAAGAANAGEKKKT